MLVVRPIGPDAGRYYAGGPPGTWVGGGAEALGLEGRARPGDVAALLHGRAPAGSGGGPLGDPAHPRRRAGWDLTFAAPKGVSLVAALLDGPGEAGAALAGAHRHAVDEALGFARRHALWVDRGGRDGRRWLAAGDGLVAVRYEHTASAAGDPHLHSHVLLVNTLLGPDGRWSAVASSPLWRSEREMGALYDLGLRHHVAARGLGAGWAPAAGGGRDLAGVPRPAIRTASRRQAEIAEHQARGRPATGRAAARAVTRPGREGGPGVDWRPAVAAAGLDRAVAAAAVPGPGRGPAAPSPPPLAAVEEAVGREASSFTVRDVLRAVERTTPGGLPATAAEDLAARVCAGAHPVPGREGRWATAAARDLDVRVARAVGGARGAGLGVVDGHRARRAAATAGLDGAGQAAVRRLLEGGHGVEVVAGAPGRDRLGAQAAVLDAARRGWQATGLRVAATAALPLAGLAPAGGPVDVLVVDRADRLAPAALAGLLGGAAAAGTKVVLVEGGTLPARARPACEALAGADRLEAGVVAARPDRRGPLLAAPGDLAVVAGGRDAVAHLADRSRRDGALLVGAGRAEVEVLNAAARADHAAAGGLTGPALHAGGRPWQAGDRIIALGADRSTGVPAGALGTVTAVAGGRRPHLELAWDAGARTTLPRHRVAAIGRGWATTAPLAVAAGAPIAALGEPPPLGAARDRLLEAVVVAPTAARHPERHPVLDAAVDGVRGAGPAVPVVDPDRPLAALVEDHRRLGAVLAAEAPAGTGAQAAWAAGRRADLLRWEALGDAVDAGRDVTAHTRTRAPAVDRQLDRQRERGLDLGLG